MLPNSWQNRLRWREKERERGKEEREESKGEKRLLKSEINKRLPVCLSCPPLFRQKSSLVFRLTWCNMDWAVSAYTGAPLETHALLLFFFHRPHHASEEILIRPYFRISCTEKVHYFGIGTVMVLEPTGSSQITRANPQNRLFWQPSFSTLLFPALEHQLEGSCLFLLWCWGSSVCWDIPPFYVLRHCFIIFTRQSLKLSGILLVRSVRNKTEVFKATTFLLVYWDINLTGS